MKMFYWDYKASERQSFSLLQSDMFLQLEKEVNTILHLFCFLNPPPLNNVCLLACFSHKAVKVSTRNCSSLNGHSKWALNARSHWLPYWNRSSMKFAFVCKILLFYYCSSAVHTTHWPSPLALADNHLLIQIWSFLTSKCRVQRLFGTSLDKGRNTFNKSLLVFIDWLTAHTLNCMFICRRNFFYSYVYINIQCAVDSWE